jgi:hypothetical protein
LLDRGRDLALVEIEFAMTFRTSDPAVRFPPDQAVADALSSAGAGRRAELAERAGGPDSALAAAMDTIRDVVTSSRNLPASEAVIAGFAGVNHAEVEAGPSCSSASALGPARSVSLPGTSRRSRERG